MNTQKGIVFENKSSYSIFLTPDGRFQKGLSLVSSASVGEEVSFRPYVAVYKTKFPVKSAVMAPFIAAVAIVLMFFSVLLPAQSTVSAFVQVDFNPSFEFGLDENGFVQQFRGLNEDGIALKREISFWKGKAFPQMLSRIVDQSNLNTKEYPQIEITTIYIEETHQDSLEKLITTAVDDSTTKFKKESVHINKATVKERLDANSQGVSVDAYNKNQLKEQKKIKVKEQPKSKDKEKEKEIDKDKDKKPNKEPNKKKENKQPENSQKDKEQNNSKSQLEKKNNKQNPEDNRAKNNNKNNNNKNNNSKSS